MAASCSSPSTSSSRRARSRRASISASSRSRRRTWSGGSTITRWSSRERPARTAPAARVPEPSANSSAARTRGRELLRFGGRDAQDADRELGDRVAAGVHHDPGPGNGRDEDVAGRGEAGRRVSAGEQRAVHPPLAGPPGAEHLVGAEDHVVARRGDVLRLDPGALVQGEPLALDERADGFRVRARPSSRERVHRREQLRWDVAAVGGGSRADAIQVRAALGDQGDPAGGVFGALAGTRRTAADRQRAGRVDQVADRDLLAEDAAVRARHVAVAPPGGHVLHEVADHLMG